MGLAGAGYGASLALEGILKQALEEKALQQQKEIQLAQIEQRKQEHADQLANQRRTIELAEIRQQAEEKQHEIAANQKGEQKRAFDNVAGLGDMGLDPLSARREAMTTLGRSGVPNAQVFAREAFPEPAKPKPHAYTYTDPRSGSESLRTINLEDIGPAGVDMGRKPEKPAAGGSQEQQWVIRGDKTVPIPKGTAQPGDLPYDPVAARSSKPADNTEAMDTAREARRLAMTLRGHKGMGGAFGVLDQWLPTVNPNTADAIAIRNALTSLLTLENTGKLKGVLSNTDMEILRQASTTLTGSMSDSAARMELERIARVMSKITGEADPFPEQKPTGIDPKVQAMIDKYRPVSK